MSYVDCDYVYSFDRYYFIFSLAFVLFQGMLNNSCIDLPSLELILGLVAAYPYRKYYTKTVLEYTFFVIYYLAFIITIKLVQEIFVKIEFIQDLMDEHPKHPAVKLNNLLFGNVDDRPKFDRNGNAKESNADFIAASFLAQLLVCFWLI